MANQLKMANTLAFLVHTGNLSVFGLELLADCLTKRETDYFGYQIGEARKILELDRRAKTVRMVIRKFTDEEWDDG